VLARAHDKRETLREARVDCINITYPSRFTIANTTRVRSRITRNWRISTTRDNSRRTILRVLQSKRTTFVLRVRGRADQTDETACANTCVHAEMYAEHHANFSLKENARGERMRGNSRRFKSKNKKVKRASNLHLGTEMQTVRLMVRTDAIRFANFNKCQMFRLKITTENNISIWKGSDTVSRSPVTVNISRITIMFASLLFLSVFLLFTRSIFVDVLRNRISSRNIKYSALTSVTQNYLHDLPRVADSFAFVNLNSRRTEQILFLQITMFLFYYSLIFLSLVGYVDYTQA